MKIAIPVSNGMVTTRFNHMDLLAILEIDRDSKDINPEVTLVPASDKACFIHEKLKEYGVNCIIAGGIDYKDQDLLENLNIEVVTGTSDGSPKEVIADYITGIMDA